MFFPFHLKKVDTEATFLWKNILSATNRIEIELKLCDYLQMFVRSVGPTVQIKDNNNEKENLVSRGKTEWPVFAIANQPQRVCVPIL